MKLATIQIRNVLGARAVDVRLATPVVLFAGHNGAGKSSVQEAVRMALTGEPVRVAMKKEYDALVTEGQESGFVEVGTSCGAFYSAVLPAGKGTHSEDAALPFVLDAQRFARLDANERRAFLFGLMGLRTDGAAVKDRLAARGCDAAKVEQIMPLLRAGFDAAQKEAAAKARDAKASWKAVTGGETWGKDKAGKWQPAPLPVDGDRAVSLRDNAVAKVREIDQELGAAQQELGAANARLRERQQATAQREELAERAGRAERIRTKLDLDTAEAAAWEAKVADARVRAGVEAIDTAAPGQYLLRGLASVTADFLALTCEHAEVEWDSSLINRAATHLAEYETQHGKVATTTTERDEEAAHKLPEYEKALSLLQNAVANGKRDLAAAEQAAEKLKELDASTAEPIDTDALRAKVADLTEKRNGWQTDVDKYRSMAEQAERRQSVIDKAAALHADVLAWIDIADALAPDGIPGEILAEALGPINERLHSNAGMAEWGQAVIHSDMRITYGQRDYALISESEKWRADAMIAEAVSHISGAKLLVLDRFDVLDAKGREDMLYWLDGMAQDGDIDTALLFGTLKALPALTFDTISSVWIDNGTAVHGMAVKLQEAA